MDWRLWVGHLRASSLTHQYNSGVIVRGASGGCPQLDTHDCRERPVSRTAVRLIGVVFPTPADSYSCDQRTKQTDVSEANLFLIENHKY